MAFPIEKLVAEGVISENVSTELKGLWYGTVDDFYGALQALLQPGADSTRRAFSKLLGVEEDKLEELKEYIKPYTSESLVNTPISEPKSLGLLIKPKIRLM